jgi:hypothetical protein
MRKRFSKIIKEISIEVIQLARANRIELLGIPAHTTHILQPLDV